MRNSPEGTLVIRASRSLVHAAMAAAVGFLVASIGCAPSPSLQPPTHLDFPAPDTGPGRPTLQRSAQRHIEQGWKALERGDVQAAKAGADRAGSGPAARLLELQAATVAGGGDPISGLQGIVETYPEYAAAWLTLSAAAEKGNRERIAFDAARRGADLWPDDRWVQRAADLHGRWVEDRIASARDDLQADRPTDALSTLAPALAVEPDNRDAVFLQVDALVALGEFEQAETSLAALPPDPEVLRHAGGVAEARGDLTAAMEIYSSIEGDPEALVLAAAVAEKQGAWQEAMDFYAALPPDWPGRDTQLRRAKVRWRLSVMPTYVQDAMTSPELDRGELAVVLVSVAPRLETLPGGQVPLLSDIMDLPSQREILTAVRLGLLDTDPVEHRFLPNRTASEAEVRHAVTTMAGLLGLDTPIFCGADATAPCTTLEAPVAGGSVAGIVLNLMEREGG